MLNTLFCHIFSVSALLSKKHWFYIGKRLGPPTWLKHTDGNITLYLISSERKKVTMSKTSVILLEQLPFQLLPFFGLLQPCQHVALEIVAGHRGGGIFRRGLPWPVSGRNLRSTDFLLTAAFRQFFLQPFLLISQQVRAFFSESLDLNWSAHSSLILQMCFTKVLQLGTRPCTFSRPVPARPPFSPVLPVLENCNLKYVDNPGHFATLTFPELLPLGVELFEALLVLQFRLLHAQQGRLGSRVGENLERLLDSQEHLFCWIVANTHFDRLLPIPS